MNAELSPLFRILLLLISVGTTLFFSYKIKKAKIRIQDVTFWLLFSAVLIVLSLFPGVLCFFSDLLGIQSPANFLFLVIIFLLLIHQFSLSIRLSMTKSELDQLARRYALDTAEEKDHENAKL